MSLCKRVVKCYYADMKYTREYFQECGRKGGNTIVEKYGLKHFKKLARRKHKLVKTAKKGRR